MKFPFLVRLPRPCPEDGMSDWLRYTIYGYSTSWEWVWQGNILFVGFVESTDAMAFKLKFEL